MFHNGHTHLKNLAVIAARSSKCVCPFGTLWIKDAINPTENELREIPRCVPKILDPKILKYLSGVDWTWMTVSRSRFIMGHKFHWSQEGFNCECLRFNSIT